MAGVSLELTGIPELQQRLQRMTDAARPVAAQALTDEAVRILDQSLFLVPVLTGLLNSTGTVESTTTGTGWQADIRYGGHGQAPYAAIVEFSTTMNHPHGGQAFYLSQPFFAATAGLEQRLADAIAAAMSSR